MPSNCMAPGCTNRGYRDKNVSYHRLPLSKPDQVKRWLNQMKLKNPSVNKFSKICSEHFDPSCFSRDLKAELLGLKPRHILNDDAVPTIFDFSGYKTATVNARPSSTSALTAYTTELCLDLGRGKSRAERLRARTLEKNRMEIHQRIDEMVQLDASNQNTGTSEQDIEVIEVPIIDTTMSVSVETQTDPISISSSLDYNQGGVILLPDYNRLPTESDFALIPGP